MSRITPWLARSPFIAILRGVRPEEVVPIAQAVVDAGWCVIEVPLNSPAPFASIARLSEALAADILVGAGTVRTPAEVDRVAEAGGRLIVMPHADVAVVMHAARRGLMALPGVYTATEAFAAIDAGADALKLFPAEIGGPALLKALRAVLPKELPVLPVGGVAPDTVAAWREAGAAGFGVGSALYRPGDDAATVGERARTFVAALG
jgi:2-dehydro-3-deoxyphosphogalactonate aldolase